MDYKEATEYIYGLKRFGIKLGLKNIERLLELMRNPQKKYKTILVGGTSGKGSTVAMISSILKEAGYKVGSYTSPHLSSFTERIVVNGKRIREEDFVRLLNEIKPLMEDMDVHPDFRHPTFFEVTTAIALKHFEEKRVDFAILEVGMGGRLDATNIVDALVSVITNVSLEHTKILGDTVLKIAREKAGIIKENGILITATEDDEVFSLFKKICDERNSKIFRVGEDIQFKKLNSNLQGQRFQMKFDKNYDDLYIPLLGNHELFNSACAIGAIKALGYRDINISEETIRKGLKKVKWPGRLEIVQKDPLVVLDCAKDGVAMKKLKGAVLDNFDYEKLLLVIGISSDKNIPVMMSEIVPISDFVIVTKHKVMNRGTEPSILVKEVKKYDKPFKIIEDVKNAVKKALSLARKKDMVLITGSVFTVGEARELWFKDTVKWGREFNE